MFQSMYTILYKNIPERKWKRAFQENQKKREMRNQIMATLLLYYHHGVRLAR